MQLQQMAMLFFTSLLAPMIPYFIWGYGHENAKVKRSGWSFLFDANKKSLYHQKTLNKNSFWATLMGDKIKD
jgi:hypothetical protein